MKFLPFLAGNVFQQISMLLDDSSPIFRQHEMLFLPRFGHFPARKMAAGKSAPPSVMLLDSETATAFLSFQGGPGTEPEPETGTVGTVFAGTERGTGTAVLSVKLY